MIYKISANYTDYLNIDIDIEELMFTVGETIGEDNFLDYSHHNLSLAEAWVDVGGTFEDVGLKNTRKPDITIWNGANFVLSQQAWQSTAEQLKPFGEFLPITVENEPYYIFNCRELVNVDQENSEANIIDGVWLGVNKLVFNESTVSESLIFKTTFDRCAALYCTDTFKTFIETLHLEGLNFHTDLLSGF